VKKHKREGSAFVGYRYTVVEEFGDALWYLAALCRRLSVDFDSIFATATSSGKYYGANEVSSGTVVSASSPVKLPKLDRTLLNLGEAVACLLSIATSYPNARQKLIDFAASFLEALQASNVSLEEVILSNLVKVRGRFLTPDTATLPTFDDVFPEDERLP